MMDETISSRFLRWKKSVAAVAFLILPFALGGMPRCAQAAGLEAVEHIVVVYQENWSFDSLYGTIPGANGLRRAGSHVEQVDASGAKLTTLPQALNSASPSAPDPRFPVGLPVAPFDLMKYITPDDLTGDLIHRFYHEQLQIHGGKMDGFVNWSDNGGLVLSYFNGADLPEGKLAREYVLCDNFFHSAFGGSFLNHQFLIAAAAPTWPNAPASSISNPDPASLNDNQVTPDGYAVNTSYTINTPHPSNITDSTKLVPQQHNPTIGDRLSEHGISWKWYSGGWADALAGHPDPLFQFHHQPFAYYANYADGTAAKEAHLRDEQEFFDDVAKGTLPAVTFIKPLGPDNEHPGYAMLLRGQQHVADIVDAVKNSSAWDHTVIIVTYDENGGRWDHVPPPVIDRWGPGTRVPAIVISPFARRGFIDHSRYETVSVLRFIEKRYGLAPLTSRDASAGDLTNALVLRRTSRRLPFIFF